MGLIGVIFFSIQDFIYIYKRLVTSLKLFSFIDVQLHNKIVVCIVASMAANRPGNGAFSWENINPSLCTHIVISTAGINNITYEINFSQWNPQTLRENRKKFPSTFYSYSY